MSSWKSLAPLSETGRDGAIAFTCKRKGVEKAFVGFGNDGTNALQDLYECKPTVTSLWGVVKNIQVTWPRISVPSEMKGRREAVAVSMGEYAIIATGYEDHKTGWGLDWDGSNPARVQWFWKFSPFEANKWQKLTITGISGGEFFPRIKAIGFCLYDKMYIGGGLGFDPHTNTWDNIMNDFWEFEPGMGILQKVLSLPEPLKNAVAFACNNNNETIGCVCTGVTDKIGTPLSDAFIYHRQVDSSWLEHWKWTAVKNVPQVLSNAVGFSLNGKGYVGVGGDEVATNNLYQFSQLGGSSWWKIPTNIPARTGAVGFGINVQSIPLLIVGTGFHNTKRLNDFYALALEGN